MSLLRSIRSFFGFADIESVDDREAGDQISETREMSDTKTVDLYTVTLVYRNGDRETFESYGEYGRSSEMIKFNTDLTCSIAWSGGMGFSYDRRPVSIQLLDREPIVTKVGSETWKLSWEEHDEYRPYSTSSTVVDKDTIEMEQLNRERNSS